MILKFKQNGKERKELVKVIAEITGDKPKYLGMPSAAYEVGGLTIDRLGNIAGVGANNINLLIEKLKSEGFDIEKESEDEKLDIIIEMPRSYFEKDSLENLEKLILAKSRLIKKALGVESLEIKASNDKISFPWFTNLPENKEEADARIHFIYALCEMARNQKRVNAKEKEVENEKYAFRCFLLRLGFIGEKYKKERNVLLKNLSGSAAFKGGRKNEVSK
ncbi:MAG: virulence protein [Anaerovoracaceae bacterium]